MDQRTCTIDGCSKPIKRMQLCYGHYMKQWRYGDPHHVPDLAKHDLTGQRFGSLVAIEYQGSRWLCQCDCGRTVSILTGDLNRGTRSCGDRSTHFRRDDTGYRGAHARVYQDHGSAKDHRCVDCGDQAAHWSYDHADPDERQDAKLGPYSLKPEHYHPRCVPCHKRFDLDHLAAA